MLTLQSDGRTQSDTISVCTTNSAELHRPTQPRYARTYYLSNSNTLNQNIGAYWTLVPENEQKDGTVSQTLEQSEKSPKPSEQMPSPRSPPTNIRKRSSTMPSSLNRPQRPKYKVNSDYCSRSLLPNIPPSIFGANYHILARSLGNRRRLITCVLTYFSVTHTTMEIQEFYQEKAPALPSQLIMQLMIQHVSSSKTGKNHNTAILYRLYIYCTYILYVDSFYIN